MSADTFIPVLVTGAPTCLGEPMVVPSIDIAAARTMVERLALSEAWQKIDELEKDLEQHPGSFAELVTKHTFCPGLYQRSVYMKAGDLITTRIHLTEHPFVISAGHLLVWTAHEGVVELFASHEGVTKPGTRRILFILSDTIWTTTHANPDNETDPEKIVARCTYNNRELRENSEELKCR